MYQQSIKFVFQSIDERFGQDYKDVQGFDIFHYGEENWLITLIEYNYANIISVG